MQGHSLVLLSLTLSLLFVIGDQIFRFLFVCLFCFFETGFLCAALEPVLELALEDQAGLELTEIQLSLLLECWDCVCGHCLALFSVLKSSQ